MLKISEISFPGIGIEPFKVDSVAFSIGGFEIAWYAIIITVGIIFGAAYTIYRTKQIGIDFDTTLDYVLITVPLAVIGARLYYVIFSLDKFHSFLDVINIRDGGLAIYGAIIVGAISVFTICKVKKISFLAFADCCTPGIIMAQGIGRWGNFMNGEAYGGVTDWFCRMGLSNDSTGYSTLYVHPTFLYESLWNVIGFVIANLIYSKKKYDGQIFLFVFGWYGLGRMFIEGLRTDSLYFSLFGLELRTSQVLAAAIFAVCAFFLIFLAIRKYEKPKFIYVKPEKDKKGK